MPEKNASQEAAAIVSDFVQAWIDEVQRAFDGVRTRDAGYSADDVVRETAGSVDRLMPHAKRGIDLGLELLRPWSQAFQQRVQGQGDDA